MNKQKQKLRKLRREQLDEIYIRLRTLEGVPKGAWIREIRESLGMSAVDLSRKLQITPPSLKKMEQNELKQTIELKTLQRVAAAMNCKLVYAIVPADSPNGSLRAILKARAFDVATKIIDQVSHTMALEDQEVTKEERRRQIEEKTEELISMLDKRLWGGS